MDERYSDVEANNYCALIRELCRDISNSVFAAAQHRDRCYSYAEIIEAIENVKQIMDDSLYFYRPESLDPSIPWSGRPFSAEDTFNPYTIDGSMSIEDYNRMHELIDEEDELEM